MSRFVIPLASPHSSNRRSLSLLLSLVSFPPPSLQLTAALERLMNNSLVELLEGLETLIVYTRNLILYPDEKKYRKIKITNIHYQVRATTQPCHHNNNWQAESEGCMD